MVRRNRKPPSAKEGDKNGEWKQDRRDGNDYSKIDMNNESFLAYYKGQNLLSDEEFESMMTSFRTPLPTTFRITGTRQQAIEILDSIENRYVPSLQNIEIDGVKVSSPEPIPFYPNKFGWSTSTPRNIIKKSQELAKFQKFLVSESEVGNISRQEAVSMVPPLLLNVLPNHWVLDMCAAPGSKTGQLIEMLHSGEEQVPSGLIVANDASDKRCYTLIHQIKRLRSPNFLVTNHEAQFFPNLTLSSNQTKVKFDRILCDVPCSGDGTLRKNYMIWKDWTTHQGLSLHNLQCQIAIRGAQLLKVGGRMVYSTCSLNPIENEAVVAELLNKFNGKLELKDVSNDLIELKRKPGVNDWKVIFKPEEGPISTFFELDSKVKAKKWVVPSMFPPSNVKDLNLERCVRIYPHLQDTGGFFVAVFEKVLPFTSSEEKELGSNLDKEVNEEVVKEREEEEVKQEEPKIEIEIKEQIKRDLTEVEGVNNDDKKVNEGGRRDKRRFVKEEPFIFMDQNSLELANIKQYFKLENFPTNQFIVRSNTDHNKTVSFVSDSVKQLILCKDIFRLKLINTGIKMFTRSTNKDKKYESLFRIQAESLNLLIPHLPKELKIEVTLMDLKTLLDKNNPFIKDLSESVKSKLNELEHASAYITFHPDHQPPHPDQPDQPELKMSFKNLDPLAFPVWKAQISVNLLIPKELISSLKQRMFGDI